MTSPPRPLTDSISIRRFILLITAVLLLNAMLTFNNIWPTLFVRWTGEVSVELAGVLLLLTAWHKLRGYVPPIVPALLAVLFVIGALSRYGAVTAQALYGREVNVYWDLPDFSSVVAMLSRVASSWILIALIVGSTLLLTALYLVARWALRRIDAELQSPRVNAVVSIAAAVTTIWFAAQRFDDELAHAPQFSTPIGEMYAVQFYRVRTAIGGTAAKDLPPSPALQSTLSLVNGSDVIVVFVESYGRVVYDRPEFFGKLTGARQTLQDAVHDTGRDVVSGFVESPTFGGESWFAHISFLTGVDVRESGVGEVLMTQPRRNFGTELARHGYRRVALMPGLKSRWPEGGFYGFDHIYDDRDLRYDGPSFGWWRIPDQFTFARFDALESGHRPRQPLFAFFPTVSTHTPFRPTPPYQSDWSRMLDNAPYASPDLQRSLLQSPQWTNMGASYVDAVDYSLQVLAGYLREHHDRNLILIVLGDHQPPAVVSGEDASWDVPVHIITDNQAVLANLRDRGFVSGIVPAAETIEPMHRLASTLLASFETTGDASANLTAHRTIENSALISSSHRSAGS